MKINGQKYNKHSVENKNLFAGKSVNSFCPRLCFCPDHFKSPLTRLGHFFCDGLDHNLYVKECYCIIDAGTKKVIVGLGQAAPFRIVEGYTGFDGEVKTQRLVTDKGRLVKLLTFSQSPKDIMIGLFTSAEVLSSSPDMLE